jgi:hypothetical protein
MELPRSGLVQRTLCYTIGRSGVRCGGGNSPIRCRGEHRAAQPIGRGRGRGGGQRGDVAQHARYTGRDRRRRQLCRAPVPRDCAWGRTGSDASACPPEAALSCRCARTWGSHRAPNRPDRYRRLPCQLQHPEFEPRLLAHPLGGVQTRLTRTSSTPGTARIAVSTSPGILAATGQCGVVNVIST